jgi:hypothetical protein
MQSAILKASNCKQIAAPFYFTKNDYLCFCNANNPVILLIPFSAYRTHEQRPKRIQCMGIWPQWRFGL